MRSSRKHVARGTAILATLALTVLPRFSSAHAGYPRHAGKYAASQGAASTLPRLSTFTSTRLHISFVYQSGPYANGEQVHVKAVGNRVYVYAGMPYREGQWVEVRTKRPGQRLQDAIRAQFLAGYSPANCVVQAGFAHYRNPAYTVMEIVPTHVGPGGNFGASCPQTYTRSNGISYFLADSRHPATFLFFSIGQYAINAGPGQTWQDTIRFLP